MKDYLKVMLAVLALLSVGSGLFLGYTFLKEHPFYSSDPDLAELEKFERAGDYSGLVTALFKKRADTAAFSKKVLPWLKDRDNKGFAPFYYAEALHLIQQQKPEDAILYFFTAGLVARVDLLRCRDVTAEKLIMQLEHPFKDVRDYLDTHPGAKISAGTFALLKEEETAARPLPEWLCTAGDRALTKYTAFVEDDEWKQRREVTRDSFKYLVSEIPGKERLFAPAPQ